MMRRDPNGYQEINPRFSYNRLACLGRGTFGIVYEGWDLEYDIPIAVKHILPLNIRSKSNRV